MKMARACSGPMQNAPPESAIVNPAEAARAVLRD